MLILENEVLQVEVASKRCGTSKHSKQDLRKSNTYGMENPAFWAKRSPVLFPIIGSLKNNSYSYQGKS